MTPPPADPLNRSVIRVETLDRETSHPVSLSPDAAEAEALVRDFQVVSLGGLALEGELAPEGARGWRLAARLTGQVGQVCVVTLEPLENTVEEEVTRLWLPEREIGPETGDIDPDAPEAPEPLGDSIDLMAVIRETLALAIDPYPRAPGAERVEKSFGPEGAEPLTDEAARPFAALAGLRARMDPGEGD